MRRRIVAMFIYYRSLSSYFFICLSWLSPAPTLMLSTSLQVALHPYLHVIAVSFQNSRGRQDVDSTIRGVLQGQLSSLILGV